MSKVSKTAKASAGTVKVEKKVISDAELIRLLRIDCSSGLYPSSQGTHALLRAYDALAAEKQAALDLLNTHLMGRKDEGGYKDLDDAIRQLLQAYITNRDLAKELTREPATLSEAVAMGFHNKGERVFGGVDVSSQGDRSIED